jgi:type VI secretion system protein ImpL
MKQTIKHLRNLPFKKELFPLILLTTFSLVLWFTGPLIAIADSVPFEQPEKRFYLILLLFAGWALKFYLWDNKAKAVAAFSPLHPELDKKIQSLKEKFQGFIGFLNKTSVTKEGHAVNLNQLPWYLLIGPSGTGKTSLLANANVNFVLSKKFKPEHLKNMATSQNCDWWVTRDMILVDVPGTYLHKTQKAANTAGHDNSLWSTLTNLIKQYRGRRALQGVVIALSLGEILNPQVESIEPYSLKQHIADLRAQFGAHLPFYFILTKCDTLPGFTEFFSDSGIDELSQAWGITMPNLKEHDSMTEIFTQRFNALIKRLNKQLISRLHQERNSLMRPHIKDFPLHIERLKESFCGFLKDLAGVEKQFHLQGVYLTSALQQHPEEHLFHLYAAAAAVTNKTMPAIQTLNMPSRPYFVRQLLMQGFANILHAPAALKKWQHRPYIYLACVIMTLAVAAFIGNDFRISIRQTNAIRAGLVQYQNSVIQQSGDIYAALPLLNALEARAHASAHSWLFHAAKAKRSAATAYREALNNIIFSMLKTHFETYLQTTDYKNPSQAYTILKAYLELGDKQYFQPDYILATLKQISPATFENPRADSLLKHIHSAFNNSFPPVILDDELVNSVRKHIAAIPPVAIGFLILKNMDGNSTQVTLPLSGAEIAGHKETIQISQMFTGQYFQPIYDRQVESAALELVQGNWVLGNNIIAPGQQNFASLAEQLRALYVSTYVSVWENLLTGTQLSVPHDLAETDAIAANLISPASPLFQLLKIIKQNTQFSPITNISPKLAAVDNIQSNTLTTITLTLRQLHTDLQKIVTAHNPSNAAFQAAAERLQDHRNQAADPITQLHVLAKNNTAPIQNWLNEIATLSWHYTLQEAGHYAENHWQTDVMSSYHSQFENRYPLWPEATEEIAIEQFAKFMNPKGTISTFFQDYLQPFVEYSGGKWLWKKMDNESLPFADIALEQILQVYALQPVFFPEKNNQIYVKFTLQPLSLEKDTQSIALNINGQTIQFDRSQPHIPQSLAWPGSKMTHETIISMQSRTNHTSNTKLAGNWGWFRLVNQSTARILNPHELLLDFSADGFDAKYYLFTKGDINPFFALQKLRLPEKLEAKT